MLDSGNIKKQYKIQIIYNQKAAEFPKKAEREVLLTKHVVKYLSFLYSILLNIC